MNTEFTKRLEVIEQTLSSTLPRIPDAAWMTASFGELPPCVQASHIEPLITPCRNLVNLGGKRWRPLLLVLSAEAMAHKSASRSGRTIHTAVTSAQASAYSLASLVELVHTASLIHDDIEDAADTRRGQPAAHITYGVDTALNAGAWLYFEAAAAIEKLNIDSERKTQLFELYTCELRRLHLGQSMDIAWHRDSDFYPTIDEYMAMVKCKTGTLSSLSVQLGIICGSGTPAEQKEGARIARDIGAGFQVLDDVTNLTTGNPGKKRGDDIVEGKKSLPVLYFRQRQPSGVPHLSGCFVKARAEGINSSAVEDAIQLLTDSGAVTEAAETARTLITQSCADFTTLFGESHAAALITELFTTMLPAASAAGADGRHV